MSDKHYIRAIYTPEKHDKTKGMQPDPDKAESVTIVEFLTDGYRAVIVLFVDEKGELRRGYLRQFSDCIFMTL